MINVAELKQKKAELKAAAEKLVNAALEARVDLKGADLEQYNKHFSDIKELESLLQKHAELSAIITEPGDLRVPDLRTNPAAHSSEVMAAFDKYLRTGNVAHIQAVTTGLNVGTATEGGSSVPTEIYQQLLDKKRDVNVMRRLANVITAGHNQTIILQDTDATAAWTAEEVAASAVKPTIKTASLGAYKGTTIIKVSEELRQDSIFNVGVYAVNQGGIALGNLEEKAFVAGGGTTEPTGVSPNATAGVTTAGATAVTSDELITHFHKLRAVYRGNATWLMKDSTALAVRLLRNAVTGDYLWQPGLQTGSPDRLLGRPVEYSENMDGLVATKRSILFGDFKTAYWICDRMNATVQVLNELYAATGQVGFKFTLRTDGAVVVAEAVQAMVQHA